MNTNIESEGAILFIGSFPPPITGQSLAFEASYTHYNKLKYKINKTPINESIQGKITKHLATIIKYVYYINFKKVDKIYMTTFSTFEGSFSDFIILAINLIYKKKVIIHLQGSNFRQVIEKSPKMYQICLIYLLKRIDAAIVLCDAMKDQFSFLIDNNKIYSVNNFYDPILENIDLESIKREHNLYTPLRIGYLSNLIYSKGITYLIDAFEELLSRGYKAELHIAGTPMSDEFMSSSEIETYLNKKINNTTIKYYGVIKDEYKVEFLKKIDVFVLPTFYRHEAQPLSIFEAMRAGCIIITTKFKYIPSFISPESGNLINIKSSSSILNSFIDIIKSPQLYIPKQEYNYFRAKSEFSLQNYLNSIYSILENTTSK